MGFLFSEDILSRIEGKPKFSFVFEGAFDQSKPEYEVAFPLRWSGQVPSTARIIVNAMYSGRKVQGPVYVKIQPADPNLPPVQVGEWADFESQSSQPVIVSLSFQDIFDYANQSEETSKPDFSSDTPWAKSTGQFEIYVEYQGEELASQIVTILNTPWFHETHLSDNEIALGNIIDAYITGNCSAYFAENRKMRMKRRSFSANGYIWWPNLWQITANRAYHCHI